MWVPAGHTTIHPAATTPVAGRCDTAPWPSDADR